VLFPTTPLASFLIYPNHFEMKLSSKTVLKTEIIFNMPKNAPGMTKNTD